MKSFVVIGLALAGGVGATLGAHYLNGVVIESHKQAEESIKKAVSNPPNIVVGKPLELNPATDFKAFNNNNPMPTTTTWTPPPMPKMPAMPPMPRVGRH